jgi:Ca2+-transporting ATPase
MPEQYYQLSPEETLQQLDSGPDGLSAAQAAERLARHGRNTIETESKVTVLGVLLDQFRSFIIYILLFATAFALLVGEYLDVVIILAIVVVNATIGFFQEWSAHRSLESLRRMTAGQATVRRGGETVTVAASELVPGDVIELAEGDQVPADARLLQCFGLGLQEAALTGESEPVAKHTAAMEVEAQIGDQRNTVFTSTSVVRGRGCAVVTATGMDTEIGRIVDLVREAGDAMTPLQRRLDRFGRRLGTVIICICLVVFVAGVTKEALQGDVGTEVFLAFALIGISLAVAAVPTALPAVVTIALSIGVKRLLRRKALVRRLSSVETLGSCDVICTDKTGTLTSNRMTVRRAWTLEGEAEVSGDGDSPDGVASISLDPLLYRIGAACNNASLERDGAGWRTRGDPTEAALLVSAAKTGNGHRFDVEEENPFDPYRKRMSVVVRDGGRRMLYAKGAPDRVLEVCSHVLTPDGSLPLDDALRQRVLEQNERYAGAALRVLGFAFRELTEDADAEEEDLTFVGLQAMMDPPRADVKASLRSCESAGIRVVMITGDYRATATAVGEELGIRGELLTGDELQHMSDQELEAALEAGVDLFSRTTPEHKLRIVAALQHHGYTVAMTGDGVNDAPALKQADIGVAVGSGTDVAKEASDFVMLDDSFTHIVNAVEEGRGIYDNIQKSIMLLLSGNLGEVLIIFLAVMLGFNLPLTAVLLLWINMVTDGAPALAYSVDPYGEDIMHRSPKPRIAAILPLPHLILIGVLGILGTAIALFVFQAYGGASEDPESLALARTMVFNFVVLYEMILVFAIRTCYRVPFLRNGWVWASVIVSLLLQALLMYTPMHSAFGIVPLGAAELGDLVMAGAVFFSSFAAYRLVFQRGLFPEVLELVPVRSARSGQ